MPRYLPAMAWTLALYIGTALTAGQALAPTTAPDATAEQIQQAWFCFELEHVILHAAAYGVLVWLMALPNDGERRKRRVYLLVNLLAISVTIGLGQEIIQSIVRWQIHFANSLMDLVSNAGGAGLTLAVMAVNRWR